MPLADAWLEQIGGVLAVPCLALDVLLKQPSVGVPPAEGACFVPGPFLRVVKLGPSGSHQSSLGVSYLSSLPSTTSLVLQIWKQGLLTCRKRVPGDAFRGSSQRLAT